MQPDDPPPSPERVTTSVSTTPWMRPAEAAEYLGIAIGTLRNWTSARFIPFVKRGGVVRYNRAELDRWLLRAGCPGRSKRSN